jgi:serine/threonine-protein kinase
VRIADFGIARMLEEPGLTQPGRVLGTGEYVSPEQALGRPVDGRSDLYALGVVLFEMLTGRPPFTGPGFADVAAQHVRAPVPLVAEIAPDTPPPLASLVTRCLQKRPEERPANARLVRMELEAILASLEDDEYETGEHDAYVPAHATAPWSDEPDPVDDPWRAVPVDEVVPWDSGPVPAMPVMPRASEPGYGLDDEPRRGGAVARWLAIMALGAALLVGAFIWNSSTGDDEDDSEAAAGGAATTQASQPTTEAQATTEATEPEEPTARPLRILNASSFDPDGDGTERDDLAPLAIDGAADTKWESEPYRGTADLEAIGKGGVGLEVELARVAPIEAVSLRSGRGGYSVAIYVSAEATSPTALADWTPVVDPRQVLAPRVRLAFRRPVRARHVLLWFTQLAPEPVNDRYGVELSEVQVFGQPLNAQPSTTTEDQAATAETAATGETAAGEGDTATQP